MSILKNKKFLQIMNIVTYFLTIAINFLSDAIPIGRRTNQISDTYGNLFAPANITFSIWGVIYTLLGIFIFYTARDLFTKKETDIPYIEQIGFYYILSNILNITWLFAWHYNIIPLSLILMFGIILTLIIIYQKLKIGIEDISIRDKILVHVPFSVYLGWISIATIANVTAFLLAVGWDGFGISAPIWTIIVLIIALILTLLILYIRKDIAFSLVVLWASIGIIIKRLNPYSMDTLLLNLRPLFEPIYYEIVIVAIIAVITVGLGIGLTIIRKSK